MAEKKGRRFWKTLALVQAILIVGFLSMNFFSDFKEEPPVRASQRPARIVQTEIVKLSDVQSQIIAFGRLTSSQPVDLLSEAEGKLLAGNIPFKPGQSFRKGDLLIQVDDRQVLLDLNSAKSDLLNALASVLPEIKVDFPDEYPVWEAYFNSCGFDAPLAALPKAANQQIKLFLSRFNVYKLYFNARNLEIKQEKHRIYAPFNGTIATADLRAGANVRNGTRLGQIINLDNMEVTVPVAAEDIRWIDPYQKITFTSSEMSGSWTGKIKRIGRTIDAQTQTIQVYMTLDSDGNTPLFEGIFLQATIPGRAIEDGLSIPKSAIYNDDYVYLINNRQLEYRQVEIARKEIETAIVASGLNENDTLVVEVLQGVAPGMPAVPRASVMTEGGSQ